MDDEQKHNILNATPFNPHRGLGESGQPAPAPLPSEPPPPSTPPECEHDWKEGDGEHGDLASGGSFAIHHCAKCGKGKYVPLPN